ncbi:M28 family peptidase [Agrilutibacter solisilvae]|uniref:M28 family peptidase n=1 Tax=Agrilutibacter solisilvae TaxID=2763317 RepID=A0A974XYB4_9GAMM|nr:M28 family peptidase [Lysobacter solisilvae]QSX77100.1 M28 family peptidase [Lysobacter solisilvae]
MRRKALPSYTIDNARTVQPWLGKVDEARILETMTYFSTRYPNRNSGTYEGFVASRSLRQEWDFLALGRSFVTSEIVECENCSMSSVVLTVRGTSKANEIVVVGGHLDSIGTGSQAPGADDNASGIATITEVIRVALADGWRPQRTVKFIGYSAGELGLRGSTQIAALHKQQNANVVGVLQLDMTNYAAGSPLTMKMVTDHSNAPLQDFLARLFDKYLAPMGMTRGTTTCGYACSDHAAWTAAGYPAAYVIEPTAFPYKHSSVDTMTYAGPTAKSSAKFAQFALAFVGELGKNAPPITPSDFDGDRRSDVFWRNGVTGANDIWRAFNPVSRITTSPVPNMLWKVAAIHDFNGDLRADVVWANHEGLHEIWYGGYAPSRQRLGYYFGAAIAAVGDFGASGSADIVLRNTSDNSVEILTDLMKGEANQRSLPEGIVPADWEIVAVGDFDGDRRDDLFWRNRKTGANELWRAGERAMRQPLTAVSVLAWRVAGTGDFNGDGRSDVVWRNETTGANVAWYSANPSTQRTFGTVSDTRWRIAAIGDYNGDSVSDLFWRHSTLGNNDLWLGGNSSQRVALTGVPADWQPQPAH